VALGFDRRFGQLALWLVLYTLVSQVAEIVFAVCYGIHRPAAHSRPTNSLAFAMAY
jgi:hypothetical protein